MSQPEGQQPLQPQYPPPTGGGCGAVALFVMGVLILLPSGLCTAVFGLGGIFELFSDPRALARDFGEVLPMLILSLGFLAIGIFAIRAALRMKKDP